MMPAFLSSSMSNIFICYRGRFFIDASIELLMLSTVGRFNEGLWVWDVVTSVLLSSLDAFRVQHDKSFVCRLDRTLLRIWEIGFTPIRSDSLGVRVLNRCRRWFAPGFSAAEYKFYCFEIFSTSIKLVSNGGWLRNWRIWEGSYSLCRFLYWVSKMSIRFL